MSRNTARPLSPHLSIWKWGPHMTVSILTRVTGVGLATVGVTGFVWWLAALASGPDAYASFLAVAKLPIMLIFPIGLSLTFFFHMLAGIRHLVMDTGSGFELKTNRMGAIAVMIGAVVLTLLMWAYILLGSR
ncbi:MAG: sdhC [Sphingomonadales bacterium]|nr:sdhC [Sphingomonadales bacterium]